MFTYNADYGVNILMNIRVLSKSFCLPSEKLITLKNRKNKIREI